MDKRTEALLCLSHIDKDSSPQTVRALAAQALRIDEDCAEALIILSRTASQPEQERLLTEERKKREERIKAGKENDPAALGKVLQELSAVYQQRGAYRRAEEALQKLLLLDPADKKKVHQRLLSLYAQREDEEALAGLVSAYPAEDARALLPTAVLAYKKGRYTTLQKILSSLKKSDPQLISLLLGREEIGDDLQRQEARDILRGNKALLDSAPGFIPYVKQQEDLL